MSYCIIPLTLPTILSVLAVSTGLMACTAEVPAQKEQIVTQAKEIVSNVAQDEADKPVLSVETIGENMYVIFGPGGNIGVSTGDDGIVIIDDKFQRNAAEILTTLNSLSDQPLRYVLNTHYHGDHTGSNAEMKETGATVMAHENVRMRMGMTFENKVFGRITKATSPKLWPTLTFSETATLYFNGQQVDIIHVPRAHTDGDSIIKFKESNIIHMGDNYFNGLFPYIDVDGGGSINGMIAAHGAVLDMADADTKIIPGHGPMATKSDLEDTQALLISVRDRVQKGIDDGKSVDTLVKEAILEDYSEYAKFINEENMIRIAYRSLSKG